MARPACRGSRDLDHAPARRALHGDQICVELGPPHAGAAGPFLVYESQLLRAPAWAADDIGWPACPACGCRYSHRLAATRVTAASLRGLTLASADAAPVGHHRLSATSWSQTRGVCSKRGNPSVGRPAARAAARRAAATAGGWPAHACAADLRSGNPALTGRCRRWADVRHHSHSYE